nr:MAG TPA: hypothetical protein [Caudoviricetes sp.]
MYSIPENHKRQYPTQIISVLHYSDGKKLAVLTKETGGGESAQMLS